ncbi:MAG: CDP-diacylglycerol--glycerol-3-phosphate 3-phosphatidyltransferase [Rickettsiaceae bacterium]|nr:CDP-diacylglycerol--glycerol-3-phosphate 3-phosphatidyltransferase [Rickettsiaceae bacterium]
MTGYFKFLPILLTIMRIILVIPIWICLSLENIKIGSLLAFGLYISAACTDFLDGYLARKWDAVTILGKILDPVADKILVSCILIKLVFLQYANPLLASVIISREILISGIRESSHELFFSKTAVLDVSFLSKIKTGVQFLAITILLLCGLDNPYINFIDIGNLVLFAASVLSFYTAFQYIYNIMLFLAK